MMGRVGPPVPPEHRLACSFSAATDLIGSYCGAVATVHALIDQAVDDPDEVPSTLACVDHADLLKGLAFTWHEVGGDCCIPDTYMHWERSDDGSIRSWCDYPDEDHALTAAVAAAVPARVLVPGDGDHLTEGQEA